MEASFTATRERARAEGEDAPATSEEEIETLVVEAIRKSRCNARNSSKRQASRR
jgi:hypothetical protein